MSSETYTVKNIRSLGILYVGGEDYLYVNEDHPAIQGIKDSMVPVSTQWEYDPDGILPPCPPPKPDDPKWYKLDTTTFEARVQDLIED